jgi:hypothetical protein
MKAILNSEGNIVAYLYLNIILDKKQEKVWGILLGNCFFGQQKKPIGKFFNGLFRKKTGKIIAKLDSKVNSEKPQNHSEVLYNAWKLLQGLKEHDCEWIEEKEGWAKIGFEEYLSEK